MYTLINRLIHLYMKQLNFILYRGNPMQDPLEDEFLSENENTQGKYILLYKANIYLV